MRALLPVLPVLLLAACGGGALDPRPAPVSPVSAGLYVANVRSANVVHLSSNGMPLLLVSGGLSPSGVGTTLQGDVGIAGNQQTVEFFHPEASAPFTSFSSTAICGTRGIAFADDGAAFVGDPICNKILVFAPGASGTTAPVAQLQIVVRNVGALLAFDVDSAGNVYVLSGGGGVAPSIGVYRRDGNAFTETSRIPSGSDFPEPAGLAVDANGNIFVSDRASALVEYARDGVSHYTLVHRPVSGLCAVSALKAASVEGRQYIFAANSCASGSVTAYDVTDAPNPHAVPAFTIAGPATQLGITAGSAIAVDRSGGASSAAVYVSNPQVNTVNAYCFLRCFGDSNPSSQFATGYPGMDGIQAIWFSGGLMYTTDSATPAISIYAAPANTATGARQPPALARIFGPHTELCGASYALTDSHHNVLVSLSCADTHGNYVAKYALPANARGDTDIAPTPFAGTPGLCSPSHLMCNPQQMLLDDRQNLYVTNYGNNGTTGTYAAGAILKFSSAGSLTAMMTSADIHNPSGIAADPQGNIGVLSNVEPRPEIAFFSPPSDQASPNMPLTVAPLRTISGPATQLGGTPFPQMVIDRDGTVYVDEFTKILVFAPGASGNAAPSAVFAGPILTGGTGIALQP